MRLKATRKAISPVIATVIIVAVAIAISIAVAGWLFGLWGSLATAQPEIKVTGVSAQYDGTANTLTVAMVVTNNGNASDKILQAVAILPDGSSVTATSANITPTDIPANSEQTVTITFDVTGKTLNAGDRVVVEIVFAETGKHSVILTVTTV